MKLTLHNVLFRDYEIDLDQYSKEDAIDIQYRIEYFQKALDKIHSGDIYGRDIEFLKKYLPKESNDVKLLHYIGDIFYIVDNWDLETFRDFFKSSDLAIEIIKAREGVEVEDVELSVDKTDPNFPQIVHLKIKIKSKKEAYLYIDYNYYLDRADFFIDHA